MNRIVLLFILFCMAGSTNAQTKIRFNGEALSVKMNLSGDFVAITTKDSLLVYRLPEMTLYKKSLHHLSYPVVLGFAPSAYKNSDMDDVLILQENHLTEMDPALKVSLWMQLENYQKRSYGQRPKDSALLWSISKETAINVLPGNYYFDFFSFREMGVSGFNHINKAFVGASGDSVFTASKATIFSRWDSEKTYQSELNAVIKKIITSPVNTSFTVIVQDPATQQYRILVKNVETHKDIYQSPALSELPRFFSYSGDGKLFLYAVAGGYHKESIEVLDIESKKTIASISVSDNVTNAAFSNEDSCVSYSTTDRWIRWNIADGRVEKEISGTAFFSGFRLLDAITGNNFLLVHTQAMSNTGTALSQSEIQLSPYDDFNVFANIEKGGIQTIALQDEFSMQINDLPESFFDLCFNPAKTHFSILGNNKKRLQIWEAKSRKKILDKYFENRIDGFVDASGRYVWVIEYKKDDGLRYRIRHIDLQTGKMTSSDQLIAALGEFKNNSSYVNGIAVPGEPNAWYIIDGDSAIWKFKGDNFKPEKFAFSVPGFRAIRSIVTDDKGIIYTCVYNANKENNILAIDFSKKTMKTIAEGNYPSVIPYKDGLLLEYENGFEIFRNGEYHQTTVEGKFIRMVYDKLNDRILVQSIGANGNDILSIINAAGVIATQNLPERPMGMNVLNNGQIVYISDAVKTFVDAAAAPIIWNASLPRSTGLDNVSVSPSGRYILAQHMVVDLKEANRFATDPFVQAVFVKGKEEAERVELFSRGWNKNRFFSIRRISLADTTNSDTQVKIPDNSLMGFEHNQAYLSPDGKWLVTYTMGNLGDSKAGPMVWNIQTLKGFGFPPAMVNQVPIFSSDTGRLFIKSDVKNDEKTLSDSYLLNEFRLDADKGPVFVRKEKQTDFSVALPGEYNFELPDFTSIDWKKPNSIEIKKQFFSPQNMHCFIYSPAHRLLFGGTAEGTLHVWDINGSSSPLHSVQATTEEIKNIIVRDDKVFVFSSTGNVGIYSLKENKMLANLQYLQKDGENKLAMYTPDKFFNLDPEAMDALHFVRQGHVFPLSSYELQGNRPDKVYNALGFADKGYIETLNKGWLTRLKRVGAKPSEKFLESHGPDVNWSRDNMSLVSKDKNFRLSFSAADTAKSAIAKLLIRINGVPLTGRNGIEVKPAKQQMQFNEFVELNTGKNIISIIAINSRGEESIEQTQEIYYLPQQKQPSRLLYIGIGVSQYKDSANNLVYAAKDVKDIATHIKYYADSTQAFTLTNSDATLQKIKELKSLMKNTRADDVVVLSFSGHGMIDSSAGFLFAPYDMDFAAPAKNGLSMTMIEDLLDDIPARKRLLLLDACHSGEQLEGLSASAKLPEGVKEINTKGVDKIKKKEEIEKEADRKGYMVMKDLFSDFSRGNGAFMISAAASNEFALESRQWNNGVFTASFLEALQEVKDKAADKTIRVRELRKAIYEKVKQRTGGQQTPTSRQENGWWNWNF